MNSSNNHPEYTEQNHGNSGESNHSSNIQEIEAAVETVATVEENAAPSLVAENTTEQVEPFDVTETTDQLAQTVWADATPVSAEPNKKHTKLAAILAVVAVVLCVLGGVGYWLYPKIKMTVVGPTTFYLHAERRALLGALREVDKAKKLTEYSMSGKFDCQVFDGEIPEEAREVINKASIKFSKSYSQENQAESFLLGLLYEDKDIASILTEQKDGAVAISLPGLIEGKYLLENAVNSKASFQDITGMDEKEFFLYIWDYYETVLDAIPSSNIKTHSSEFKHLSCTATTMHIDQKTAEQICKSLAQKLQSDEKLIPLLTHIVDYLKSIQGNEGIAWPEQSQIKEAVHDIIAELEAVEVPEDFSLDFIVSYDGRGRIMGRELRSNSENPNESGSILLASYTAGVKKITELEMTSSDMTMAVRHSYMKMNGAHTGDLTVDVKADGQESQPVKVTYSLYPETIGGVKTLAGQLKIQVLHQGTGVVIDWDAVKKNNKLDTEAKLTVLHKDTVGVGLRFTGAIEMSNQVNLQIDMPKQSTMDPNVEDILNALCENIDSTGLIEDLFPDSGLTAQDFLGRFIQLGDGYHIGDEMYQYPDYFLEDFYQDDTGLL